MLGFVAASVAVSWAGLDVTTRLIFTGLGGLGLYMLWRAGRAGARLRRQEPGWQPRYLDEVGFTLISLFDGFVIVGAIDLGLPVWLVVLVAVGGVLAGIQAMKRAKRQLVTAQPASEPGQGQRAALNETALADDIVLQCGLGSFPASDPPSWWAHAGTNSSGTQPGGTAAAAQ